MRIDLRLKLGAMVLDLFDQTRRALSCCSGGMWFVPSGETTKLRERAMKSKKMTVFLHLVCVFCLVIGLAGCGSSDGGMLGPSDEPLDIGDVSDDSGDGGGDGGGDDGNGDDEINDDETNP